MTIDSSQPTGHPSQPAPDTSQPTSQVVRRPGVWRQGAEVFLQNRLAVLGLVIVLALVLFSFVGPLFYHTDQTHTDIRNTYIPPGPGHPLGTDGLGYDQLGRLMVGGQTSITVGLLAGIFATFIGTLWGAVAGFIGGKVDSIMMRVVDAIM